MKTLFAIMLSAVLASHVFAADPAETRIDQLQMELTTLQTQLETAKSDRNSEFKQFLISGAVAAFFITDIAMAIKARAGRVYESSEGAFARTISYFGTPASIIWTAKNGYELYIAQGSVNNFSKKIADKIVELEITKSLNQVIE